MQIRRATQADAEAIARAHDAAVTESCRLHYPAAERESWLWRHVPGTELQALDDFDCFVALDDSGGVIGFGFLDLANAEIVAVYVHPRTSGRGVGKALLRHLEAHAGAAGCTALVLKASLNAVEFYWSAGYHPTGPSRHRFRSGVEARCFDMTRALVRGASVAPSPPDMPVFLVPHDPSWATQFERERAVLLSRLAPRVVGIEHVGSTAIPGIDAKPIIDVLVLVPNIEAAPSFFAALEGLEYEYFPTGEREHPERRWFCKPNPTARTHHLHLVQSGSPWHRGILAFRDHLRAHPGARARYQALKRELARRFPEDREAYTEGKKAFIRDVVADAARDALA